MIFYIFSSVFNIIVIKIICRKTISIFLSFKSCNFKKTLFFYYFIKRFSEIVELTSTSVFPGTVNEKFL